MMALLQMHPVLRHMKPPASALESLGADDASPLREEGEGLARLSPQPETHPRVQLKKDAGEAYVPRRNVLRDDPGDYPDEMRDVRFRSGRHMRLDPQRVLTDEDFEVDTRVGVSPARAHLEAADLATAYQQTLKEERSFQQSFNNHVRHLVVRQEVVMGLMHLWDFAESYVEHPQSKALTAQLCLIAQHARDESLFREALLSLAEPEGRWLLDLINVLQSIVVQERSLSPAEKVAAVNYAVMSLAKFYARKMYQSPYVPLDKEVKVQSFYMRMVLKVLSLSEDLGAYRNERMERMVGRSRFRELNDSELLYGLKRALTADDGGDEGSRLVGLQQEDDYDDDE